MSHTEQLERKLREARMEHRWYRQELLDMIEEGNQRTGPWDEYREEMKRTGRETMELSWRLKNITKDTPKND